MPASTRDSQVYDQLQQLDASHSGYATRFVEILLGASERLGVSDVHLHPAVDGLDVRWRLDGVLQPVGRFPRGEEADIVARLKVLAELLTYRSDIPQEGRIRGRQAQVEMRVSTFPTLHGERAVVRLFAAQDSFRYLDELGLPADVRQQLQRSLAETSGAILITGPAGSGKTTTAYACLRELVRTGEGMRSIVSLEDPIEVAIDGVAQSQVQPSAGFDLATGLRSMMRQDPEVILVGEIRDRATAESCLGACLTGHLVLTTLHAGSAAAAISRLGDMGIEPYLLRSGILAIVNQRLVRRLCGCARPLTDAGGFLGLPVGTAHEAMGCQDCFASGYRGRMLLVEMLTASDSQLGRAILSRSDASQLEQLAVQAGMVTRWQRACEAVQSADTSPAEVRRVLGFSGGKGESRG